MNKIAKVVMSAVVIIVFIALMGALVGIRESSGNHTPGIFGLILFVGVIGAVRAIWKSSDDQKDDDNNNTSILQK